MGAEKSILTKKKPPKLVEVVYLVALCHRLDSGHFSQHVFLAQCTHHFQCHAYCTLLKTLATLTQTVTCLGH